MVPESSAFEVIVHDVPQEQHEPFVPEQEQDDEDTMLVSRAELETYMRELVHLREVAADMSVFTEQVKTLLIDDFGIEIFGEWSLMKFGNTTMKISKKVFSKTWQEGFKQNYAGLMHLLKKHSTSLEKEFAGDDVARETLTKIRNGSTES